MMPSTLPRKDLSTKTDGKRRPPPDRYCVEASSKWRIAIPAPIRIALDGIEQSGTVVEYCVSGRWARVHTDMKDGKPVPNMLKTGWKNRMVQGVKITVWWSDEAIPPDVVEPLKFAPPVPPAPAPAGNPA